MARRNRKIQAGTSRDDDRVTNRPTRHAEVPGHVVRLLPHYRILRRLSHRTHGCARRSLSGRLSRRWHCGVPRLRSRTPEQWHLEGSAVERDLQGSYRWTRLRLTDRRHLWLAVAPLIRPARTIDQIHSGFFQRWRRSVAVTCILQVIFDTVSNVPGEPKSKRRSGCPVSISLERFGDRWSLLIIRDLMVRGFRTFKDFQESGEGIATNILTDRLQKLEASGIITAEVEETDARRVNYRLTGKGIDLAPVLLDLLIWGARHEETMTSGAAMVKLEKTRDSFLAEVRRRWQVRDSTPLVPKFANGRVYRS